MLRAGDDGVGARCKRSASMDVEASTAVRQAEVTEGHQLHKATSPRKSAATKAKALWLGTHVGPGWDGLDVESELDEHCVTHAFTALEVAVPRPRPPPDVSTSRLG